MVFASTFATSASRSLPVVRYLDGLEVPGDTPSDLATTFPEWSNWPTNPMPANNSGPTLTFNESSVLFTANIRFINYTSTPAPGSNLTSGDVSRLTIKLQRLVSGSWVDYLSTERVFTYPATPVNSTTSVSHTFTNVAAGSDYRVTVEALSTSAATGQVIRTDVVGAVQFTANRAPGAPTITSPPTGILLPFGDSPGASSTLLTWSLNDPDKGVFGFSGMEYDYSGWEVQVRPAPTVGDPDPAWATAPYIPFNTGSSDGTITNFMPSGSFNAGSNNPANPASVYRRQALNISGGVSPTSVTNTPWALVSSPGTYQIRVRVRDGRFPVSERGAPSNTSKGLVSPWSLPITVTWTAPYLPPIPLSPSNEIAVSTTQVDFSWQFRDPRSTGGSQNRREVQIREVGSTTWFQVIPTAQQASATQNYSWTVAGSGFTLVPGKRYEWQVRTRSTPGNHVSTWSESAFFWAIPAPGSGTVIPVPDLTIPDDGLGIGNNRVLVFDRGGQKFRGELSNKVLVRWNRKRDDMSNLTVRIEGWDEDDIQLLSLIRTWMHELVVYREVDGQPIKRVWEGPVTRIAYGPGYVEFEAHDVMAYVYRRILRQGWNDAYRAGGGGLTQITVRAAIIIQNALAYDDPNVLPYLQVRIASDDARQSRVVPDFSSSAFEAVDSLAATAGLDYTAAGRRIILWDTHNRIGLLPKMGEGDFDSDIIITEYGMRLANVYAISNNQGVYGVAERPKTEYGYVEMVDSAYGETDAGGVEETLTEEARLELIQTLTGQAERSIASRYPAPVICRVPDNSRIMPDVQVGINQLIPGVFIPLVAEHPIRSFEQTQKLDSLTVEQIGSEESVRVVLSPAPRDRNDDPDSGAGEI